MSLFDILEDKNKSKPLADKLRPLNFDGFIGQEYIIGKGKPLRRMIENNQLSSLIFWGPPGCGKTTLARIIANLTDSHFRELSAVTSGIKDLRQIIDEAKQNLRISNKRTIVFVDEIHRYNKVQQDAILPYVENGTIVVIGATTENPSFEIIPALKSRVQIIRLNKLTAENLKMIINKAIQDKENGIGNEKIKITEEAKNFLVIYSTGDARYTLNLLEAASKIADIDETGNKIITIDILKDLMQQASVFYDKSSDEHYDHLSAFQKSLRGSDPNGAIYWLAKMLEGGEDPRVIARRLLVTASEDVSNANPLALIMANAAFDSVSKLGMPECRIPLAQAAIYIAIAPKSNSAITAIDKAISDIKSGKVYPVPIHLKDTHYKDAKNYGHGEGYIYSHSNKKAYQQFLPDELKDKIYYSPGSPEEEKIFNKD